MSWLAPIFDLISALRASLHGATYGHPEALYLLVAVGAIFVVSLVRVRFAAKALAITVRTAALVLLVLALAEPEHVTRRLGSARPPVVDVSASITSAMRSWTADLLVRQLGFRGDDPAVVFAGAVEDRSLSEVEQELRRGGGCADCGPDATNLERALREVVSRGQRARGPLVLVTDGWETQGAALDALAGLRSAATRLFIFTPPSDVAVPNVALTRMILPATLVGAESFALGVVALNEDSRPVSGTIRLFENGKPIDAHKVTLPPGSTRIDFPLRTAASGLVSYRASFAADDPAQDRYQEDNSTEGWIGVGAHRRVLIITDTERDAKYLREVMKRIGVKVEVALASRGMNLRGLESFQAVLLNNVPRDKLSKEAQEALVSYVTTGGALAMVGGDKSFGLGGYRNGLLEKALPVVMKPPQHKHRTRALVLVIDKSGSMGRKDKLAYAKAATLAAASKLRDDDYLSVIGFDSQPFVVVPLEPLAKSRSFLKDIVERLKPQGTTFLLPALKEANRALAANSAAIKHVVILTDGETGGTAAMYYDLVSTMHREGGITVSTIAIGSAPNLKLLEALANYGGGAFYHTDSPKNLPEIALQDLSRNGGEVTMVEKKELIPETIPGDPLLGEISRRKLPPLKGYVQTELKKGARLDAFIGRENARDPLLASWRFGAGKAIAFTSDASGRWSSPWIQGDFISHFWDRVLTWMMPPAKAVRNLDVEMGYMNGRLKVKIIDYDAAGSRAVDVLRATVTRPDGSRAEVPLSEDGPGELSASIEASRPGVYRFNLSSNSKNSKFAFPPLAYTVPQSIRAEIPRPLPNYGLLEHLASATGGLLNPLPDSVHLARPTIEVRVSDLRPFVIAAMVLIVLEAFVRRLAG